MVPHLVAFHNSTFAVFLLLLLIIIINVKIIVTLSQKMLKKRGTVQNVMSKFAVNAVQQIDSAIMSGLQRMP